MLNYKLKAMIKHIINIVHGWRIEDYDGYNDYYVNPEFKRKINSRIADPKEDSEEGTL